MVIAEKYARIRLAAHSSLVKWIRRFFFIALSTVSTALPNGPVDARKGGQAHLIVQTAFEGDGPCEPVLAA